MPHSYRKNLALILLAGSSLLSTSAYAANSNIKITGLVIASPCVVNGGVDQLAVNLGTDIQANALATAGSTSSWINFPLSLTGCPASTTSFSVAFSGTADTNADYYLNNGTASNLAVELTTQDGATSLKNGASLQNVLINASSHSYDLLMRARAVSKGAVMPGTIESQVQATFTYQ